MKLGGQNAMRLIRRIVGALICSAVFIFSVQAQNKYVGTKMCGICHRTEKQGSQLVIWQKTKHAEAYKTLMTEKANETAKKKGIKKPAVEAPECLECHTFGKIVDAKLLEKSFDIKDGVQCETCHGPGSVYKSITTMKDKEKAIKAGLTAFKDDAAIEKFCRTCHNEKSPFYKEFNLKEMWAKIKHPIPAKG
jgi:hypothetical protein